MKMRRSAVFLLALTLIMLAVAPSLTEETGVDWSQWEDLRPPPDAIDSEGFTWDSFRSGFAALYGFQVNSGAVYIPMFYQYVGFEHSVPLTYGEADGLNYVVHYDVTRPLFEDYLLYLKHFGYDVALDFTTRSTRYVELRFLNAPDYMPVAFRCYYNANDETLVTADPAACEAAYAAKLAGRPEPLQDEVGQTLALADGAQLTLEKIVQISSIAVTTVDSPLLPGVLTNLLARSITLPTPFQTLTTGDTVAMLNIPYGVFFLYDERFALLKCTAKGGQQPLNLSEYEFSLSCGAAVTFACDIGSYLYMQDGLSILASEPPAPITDTQTFWVAFIVDGDMNGQPIRFSMAKAANRVPLPDRVSLGFVLDADYLP